jgi:hypothetical protein
VKVTASVTCSQGFGYPELVQWKVRSKTLWRETLVTDDSSVSRCVEGALIAVAAGTRSTAQDAARTATRQLMGS